MEEEGSSKHSAANGENAEDPGATLKEDEKAQIMDELFGGSSDEDVYVSKFL